MKCTIFLTRCHGLITLGLLAALAACDNGPKTYDACMLQASKNAKSDYQFQVMSKDCRDKFQVKYQ